jgi:hypothetical protein
MLIQLLGFLRSPEHAKHKKFHLEAREGEGISWMVDISWELECAQAIEPQDALINSEQPWSNNG